jgi:hypothetical protein
MFKILIIQATNNRKRDLDPIGLKTSDGCEHVSFCG